jgi:hypothetical protein
MTESSEAKSCRLPEPIKICPICDTVNHRNAMVCVTCGTSLTDVDVTGADGGQATANGGFAYDFRYGETDLYEDALRRKGQAYLGVLTLGVLVVMGVGALLMLAPALRALNATRPVAPGLEGAPPGAEPRSANPFLVTNTPRPTIALATVTAGPPTATRTVTPSLTPTETVVPTPAPCVQVVGAGEGLLDLAIRCGHGHYAVVAEIVRLNGLASEIDIREGQQITIPWPTPAPDPNAADTDAAIPGSAEAQAVAFVGVGLSDADIAATQAVDPFFAVTPTLPPGIMYHYVAEGEDISSIIYDYNTNIEVLNQLNPEITFSQCEFGVPTGGPRCIVIIYAGQSVRVPAPTPTPTLSPTPSGSETPTPTPTATFNAPSPVSPSNRAYFRRDQWVTLRWVGSAALAPGQTYQVEVEDLTRGLAYSAQTSDLFFVLPAEWQARVGPYEGGTAPGVFEYRWTVSIVDQAAPGARAYTTPARTFTWEGLPASEGNSTP